jgi:hypothetical protein
MKKFAVVFVLLCGLFAACGGGGDNGGSIEVKDFPYNWYDSDITIRDNRTGYENIEGIVNNIKSALVAIEEVSTPTDDLRWGDIVTRGLIILIEKPSVHYDECKVVSWNMLSFDIDYLTTATVDDIRAAIKAKRSAIYNSTEGD